MRNFSVFKAYRYQLLPIDRNDTKDLYHDRSPEDIIKNKNKYFAETLLSIPNVKNRKSETIIRVKKLSKDLFSIYVAPSRPLLRETAESVLETVDNWPHIDAWILNSQKDQYLLIQEKSSAFASTDTVTNLIKKATKPTLEKLGISLHIEPLFKEAQFWTLVNEYKNKITWVNFEFITPNMANISHTLASTLKQLGKESNSVREEISLASDPASSLDISKDNETIRGLVDYTSNGGGNISMKVRGLRKKISTAKFSREVELSGLEISAAPDQITKIIREMLK